MTLARAPAEMTFRACKSVPATLGNNAGESLSLDGTPRRAEPKTARRWTEKKAGKGEASQSDRGEKEGRERG